MRKRRNKIQELREKVPKELRYQVDILEKEIKGFFQNMTIYTEDNLYEELFRLLYLIYPPLSYLDICEELHLNEKRVKKFIRETERFIYKYIEKNSYFTDLRMYMHK